MDRKEKYSERDTTELIGIDIILVIETIKREMDYHSVKLEISDKSAYYLVIAMLFFSLLFKYSC
jgi:hypothetical protein